MTDTPPPSSSVPPPGTPAPSAPASGAPAPGSRRSGALRLALPLLVLVLLAAAGGWGWHMWQQAQALQRVQAQSDQVRLAGLEQSLEGLRRDQRASSQRLQDAAATNRVLRDEMLGLGQRSAVLEENLARLAETTQRDSYAVQRDEAELLLAQALQRLEAADDLDGARRLYAQAAVQLGELPASENLNLMQTLMQEREALDKAGTGPRALARQRLAAFALALQALPTTAEATPAAAGAAPPWWQRALAPFVEMTPTRLQGPLTDAERVTGLDALQLEISLARAAIERGDAPALGQAAERITLWLNRLWPDSPALRTQRAELRQLSSAPLRLTAPELGSTLQQLRTLHDGGSP